MIKLKLTDEEARVLIRILSKVGGDPDGMRGTMDNIFNELRNQGVPYRWQDTEKYLEGNLFFRKRAVDNGD